ncbi:MAG: hypothetical protein MUO58_13525 [Anaerolineales bacterium]|jgi:hypothetical protein|nr:hypothetical protein [Anaerolineales bacterium]
MNRRKSVLQMIGLSLVFVLSNACSTTAPSVSPTATQAPPTAVAEATATEVPPTPVPTQQIDWFDGRIGLSLDAIEETRTLPAEYEIADASEGHTYLSIYLSVTRVEGVHLVYALGYEREKSVIHGANGQTYESAFGHFKGVKFADLTNLLGSAEFVPGAEGIFAFEIPEGTEITELVFIYSYKESLDDKDPIRGEMIIVLP